MATPSLLIGQTISHYRIIEKLGDYYEFLKGETGEINEKIFESNVRGFWQNTWVNKRIQSTLENSAQPRR